MTVNEAVRAGAAVLKEAGVPDASHDAGVLFELCTGLTRTRILAYPDEKLSAEAEESYFSAVKRRAGREPLQYITGEQGFMGLTFRVDNRVLIPRQDTETLVLEALKYLKSGMRVLDLCTGSGCIIISLAVYCKGIEGTGSDISSEALEAARENAKLNGVTADFVESDLFGRIHGSFDLIISNPPYIKSGDIRKLMEEVRDYEPAAALDGHADGLYFYEKIASEAPLFLKKGGRLMVEIGYDQAEDVTRIFGDAGFGNIHVVRDLSGLNRVVEGCYV